MEAIQKIALLSNIILPLCDPELIGTSRLHKSTLFSTKGKQVFIKREDETGFLVSGTKRRKYASLIPWLQKNKFPIVGLIGGEHSNHLPAFLQLCREKSIPVKIFLKNAHQQAYRGNRFLLHLLAQADEFIRLDPEQWPHVEKIAREILGPHAYIVPEGGSCAPALPGAASLLIDILRNENTLGQAFDHVFMDAGTGMSAIGLHLAQNFIAHPAQLHIVRMAGSEASFLESLEDAKKDWEHLIQGKINPGLLPILYTPDSAKSFGSLNRGVMNMIQEMAKSEGLLLDPVYNAKLFSSTRQILKNPSIMGNICIIHSGGGTGLMGFADALNKKNPVN